MFQKIVLFALIPSFLYSQTNVTVVNDHSIPSFTPKVSFVTVPFDISVDDVAKQLNKNLGDVIYEDNSFEDNNKDDLKIKVWKKGDFVFTQVISNTFFYEIPLKVWVQKQISILGVNQAPATEFEVKMKFYSEVGINPDYTLQTKTLGNGFDWISKPSLKTSFADIPITAIITPVLKSSMEDLGKKIDQTIIEKYSLKPYVLSAWNSAKTPFKVSDEYNTWVSVKPQELYMTPLVTADRSLKSALGLKVIFETVVGNPNTALKPDLDIPNLKLVKSLPNTFDIQLYNNISYDEATRIANKTMANQVFEFKNGKYKETVKSIDISFEDNKMIVLTDLMGTFNGKLKIKGKPIYDPTKKAVVLTDTEIDVKTKNFLHKSAAWLLEGYIEKKIQEEFQLPVNDIIEFGKNSALAALNSEPTKGVKLKANINAVEPQEVFISPNSINALVNAKGNLEITVKGL